MFSNINRQARFNEMSTEIFDLLVIGGGITGAGIALDAASRGINTALVEMQDFAAGTSSRSTKLVHGGLRYLKQFEIKVVAEVGKERAIVYENGPHVTKPEWMLLPIYQNGTFGKFTTSIGLMVYDFLAGVRKSERRKMLNKQMTRHKVPIIKEDGLLGSGYYVEYRTDDARLTIEVMKKAVEYGAKAMNYAKVDALLYENTKLVGVQVKDMLSGKVYKIYARKIVNATGPWVDDLREKDKSKKGKTLHLTKGVHLVIDQKYFPLEQAVYFDTPDGRMVFAIPREGKTYVGTTDTNYQGDIKSPRVTKKDQQYILQAIHFMFPKLTIDESFVESSWAGLRPLIHEDGKDPSEISRKDELFISESGLISIAGGKLTGYRKMAENVVNIVSQQLMDSSNVTYKSCQTTKIPISGGEVGGSIGFSSFIEEQVKNGVNLGLSHQSATALCERYGSNVKKLFQIMSNRKEEADRYRMPVHLFAEVIYTMEEESIVNLCDFFIRRTGALFFHIDTVKEWKQAVALLMADQLQWTDAQMDQYLRELEEELHFATNAIIE